MYFRWCFLFFRRQRAPQLFGT